LRLKRNQFTIELLIAFHYLFNLIGTCGFLYISKINYPGAEALLKLHKIEDTNTRKNEEKKK
jgi:hypothetical protein